MRACHLIRLRVIAAAVATAGAAFAFGQAATQEAPPDEPEVKIVLTATDRETTDFVRQAELAITGKQYEKAIELLQSLLTGERKMLLGQPGEARRYVGLRSRAIAMLKSLPPEAQTMYVRQYEPPAARLLEMYRSTGDISALQRLAEEYPLTPSAAQAADELGAIAFDRGEFFTAATWWTHGKTDALTKVKVIAALHAAGDQTRAQQLLAKLEGASTERVTIAGEQVDAVTWAKAILKKPLAFASAATPAVPESVVGIWSWPNAPAEQAKLAAMTAGEFVDGDAFRITLDQGRPVGTFADKGAGRFLRRFELADVVRPVLTKVGDTTALVARYEFGLVAIDPTSGREMWRNSFAAHEDAASAKGTATSPFLGITGDIGRYEVTTGEGKLFAVGRYRVVDPTTFRRFALEANEDIGTLAAFDAGTGKQLWAVGRGGPAGDPLSGVKFLSAPTYNAGRLHVLGRVGAEYHAFALDATNGKLLWQTAVGALPTTSGEAITWQAAFAVQTMTERGTPPTVAGERVIFTTNAGLIAAYDATSGRPVWGHRYDSAVAGQVMDEYLRPVGDRAYDLVLARRPVRSQNNMLLERGRLICLPSDSEQVLVLDPTNGELLWSRPREDAEYVAAGAGRVILATPALSVLDVTSGEVVRKIEAAVAGRPAVIGDTVLAPGRGQLLRVKLSDVEPKLFATVHGSLLSGAIVPFEGGVLTVTAGGMSGFVDGANAGDLLAKRLAAEKDPAVRAELQMTQAQASINTGDVAKAMPILLAIEQDKSLPADLRGRARSIAYNALVQQLKESKTAGDVSTLIATAQQLAESDAQRLSVGLLAVQQDEKAGRAKEAALRAAGLAQQFAAVATIDARTGEVTSGYAAARREALRLAKDDAAVNEKLAAASNAIGPQPIPMFSYNVPTATLLRTTAGEPVLFSGKVLATHGKALLLLDPNAENATAAVVLNVALFAEGSRTRSGHVSSDGKRLAIVDETTLRILDHKGAVVSTLSLKQLGIENYTRMTTAGDRLFFIANRGRVTCVDWRSTPQVAWNANGFDAHAHVQGNWLLQEDPRDRNLRVINITTGKVATVQGGRSISEAQLIESSDNFVIVQTSEGAGLFDCRRLDRNNVPILSWPFEKGRAITFLASHGQRVWMRVSDETASEFYVLDFDKAGKPDPFAWPQAAGVPRQVWQSANIARTISGGTLEGQDGLVNPHLSSIDLTAGKVLWTKALIQNSTLPMAVRATSQVDGTLACIVRPLGDRARSEMLIVEPNGDMVRTSLQGVDQFRGTSPALAGSRLIAETDIGLVFFKRGR